MIEPDVAELGAIGISREWLERYRLKGVLGAIARFCALAESLDRPMFYRRVTLRTSYQRDRAMLRPRRSRTSPRRRRR